MWGVSGVRPWVAWGEGLCAWVWRRGMYREWRRMALVLAMVAVLLTVVVVLVAMAMLALVEWRGVQGLSLLGGAHLRCEFFFGR